MTFSLDPQQLLGLRCCRPTRWPAFSVAVGSVVLGCASSAAPPVSPAPATEVLEVPVPDASEPDSSNQLAGVRDAVAECPDAPQPAGASSPILLTNNPSWLVDLMLEDHAQAEGRDHSLLHLTELDSKHLLCAVLDGGAEVLDEALRGKRFQSPTADSRCHEDEATEVRIGWALWYVQLHERGRMAALRYAVTPGAQVPSVSFVVRSGHAVAVIASESSVCPVDRTSRCENPRAGAAEGVCAVDPSVSCERSAPDSEVYVTSLDGAEALRFGPFLHDTPPEIRIEESSVFVETANCRQVFGAPRTGNETPVP